MNFNVSELILVFDYKFVIKLSLLSQLFIVGISLKSKKIYFFNNFSL